MLLTREWDCFSTLQIRLESIEAVNKILDEANKRIQPNGTGIANSYINWIFFKKKKYLGRGYCQDE